MNRDMTSKAVALAVLAATLGTASAASAKTMFLNCNLGGDEESITVNLSNNTVDNTPAKITLTSIDWNIPGEILVGGQRKASTDTFHIDRKTGVYTQQQIALAHYANGSFRPEERGQTTKYTTRCTWSARPKFELSTDTSPQ